MFIFVNNLERVGGVIEGRENGTADDKINFQINTKINCFQTLLTMAIQNIS